MKTTEYFAIFSIYLTTTLATDVCSEAARLDSSLTNTLDQQPFCDYRDICKGLYRDGSTNPVSCSEAFQIVTQRNKRELSIPPIIRICPEMDEDWIIDDERAYVDSLVSATDPSLRLRLPPALTFQLVSLEVQSLRIVKRIFEMSPRYVYVDEIDGEFLRTFVRIARGLASTSTPDQKDTLSDLIRRSDAFRKYAWAVSMMFHQASSAFASVAEIETLLISMAPWVHAFLYVSYEMDVLFPRMLQGNGWILTALSKYHPLYDMSLDVWYIQLNQAASDVRIELPFNRLDMGDMDSLRDFVLTTTGQKGRVSVARLQTELFEHIRMYLVHARVDVGGNSEGRVKTARRIKFMVHVLGHINGMSVAAFPQLDRLDSRRLQELSDFVDMAQQDESISWLSISTIRKIFGPSSFPPIMKLEVSSSGHEWVNDRIPSREGDRIIFRTTHGGDIVSKMLSLDQFDLAKETFFFSPLDHIQRHPNEMLDILIGLFFPPFSDLMEIVNLGTESNSSNTYFFRVNATHADTRIDQQLALGRLIALALDSYIAGDILLKYVVGSPSILESLFFNSHHIRRGFYQVNPDNSVEDMFSTGFELVQALHTLVDQ